MWGELDLYSLEEFREILCNVVTYRRPTLVDLSRVTFLDVLCARELAIFSQLYAHHLAFTNPSWQVKKSIRACKLESWTRFRHPVDRPGSPAVSRAS